MASPISPTMIASGRREIERGVIDAVEDIRESDHGEGQADVHQLLIGVASATDGGELLIAERALREDEQPYEAHQGVTLCVAAGLTGANLPQRLRLQACELAQQGVCGLAIVEAV